MWAICHACFVLHCRHRTGLLGGFGWSFVPTPLSLCLLGGVVVLCFAMTGGTCGNWLQNDDFRWISQAALLAWDASV